VKARELDRVQAELGDARKQMQMKDIYIRQLNAHAAGVAQQQQQEDAVNAVQGKLLVTSQYRNMNTARTFS
jgi:hypothetical protein